MENKTLLSLYVFSIYEIWRIQCSKHTIRNDELENAVLENIKIQKM